MNLFILAMSDICLGTGFYLKHLADQSGQRLMSQQLIGLSILVFMGCLVLIGVLVVVNVNVELEEKLNHEN